VGSLSNTFAVGNCFSSGVRHGCGLTRFVEFIPKRKDSMSGALLDMVFHGSWPGFNPFPAHFVSYASP